MRVTHWLEFPFRAGNGGSPISLFALMVIASTLNPSALRADSVNSPNITLNVDTNRSAGPGAGNVPITINTITIAETMLPEYSSGATRAITIAARPGFQFDPTSNVTAQSATIGFNGAAINAVASVTPTGDVEERITFNLTSGTNSTVQDIIRINGIKLFILSAVGAAGPAQTTLTVTTAPAGGAFNMQGIVAANITAGAADRLVFAAQPGSTQAGADLLPAVKIVDFGGNLVTNDVRTINLAIQTNPGAATLLGTTSVQTVAGVATWTAAEDLRINTAATGYTLRASHSGGGFPSADTVDSGLIDITAGAPNQLAFSLAPQDTAAGADILLAVTLQDQAGNTVINQPVEITLDSSVNPGGWPLLVDTSLTKTTVAGVATWADADNLRINNSITGYRLQASGVGTPVQTDPFNITPADASSFAFIAQPSDTLVDAAITPPITVEVLDAFGNRADFADMVELFLQSPCGGTLSGGTATASAGLATFPAVRIDTPCADVELEATSGTLARTNSEPFAVTALPDAALRFVQQPTDVAQDAAINPPVSVEILDTAGNRSTSTATVQLTLISSCGGNLSTTSADAVGGLATFAILSIDTPCPAVTLQATADDLTGATSDPFNVTELAAEPVALAFLQQPTDVTAEEAINPTVTIEILDANGVRTAANTTIELTLLSDCGGTLSTTSVDATNGLATLTALSIDTPCAAVMLQASADGLTDATSDEFEVSAAQVDDLDDDMGMGNGVGCGGCGAGGAVGMVPMLLMLIGMKMRFVKQRRGKS